MAPALFLERILRLINGPVETEIICHEEKE